MITQLRYAALAVSLALVTAAAGAQGKSRHKDDKGVDVAVRSHTVVLTTDSELRIFRDYYRARGHKPKPLPPGIAKNLARGKRVPPGLMRSRLPDDLVVILPRRDRHEWYIANDVILLVDVTGVVRDIVRNVF